MNISETSRKKTSKSRPTKKCEFCVHGVCTNCSGYGRQESQFCEDCLGTGECNFCGGTGKDMMPNQVIDSTERELDERFAQLICGFKKLPPREQAIEVKDSGVTDTWFYPPKHKRISDTEYGDRMIISAMTALHYHKDIAEVFSEVARWCSTKEKAQTLDIIFCQLYEESLVKGLMQAAVHAELEIQTRHKLPKEE